MKITSFYVGQYLELPTKLELTPRGISDLKSRGLLKTKKYKVIKLYSENGCERVVFEVGKKNHHDKHIDSVKKIIASL